MDYESAKRQELRGRQSDFSISMAMHNAIKNEMWRSKTALWTILSAACDDAGSKCYEYVNTFADKLTDVDICTVDALRSIAKSVDLEFLVKDIPANMPVELKELIDILSISKSHLLGTRGVLNTGSTCAMLGPILKRCAKGVNRDDFNMTTLFDIKRNISHFRKILNQNLVYEGFDLSRLLTEDTMKELKDAVTTEIGEIADSVELSGPDYESDHEQELVQQAVAELKDNPAHIERLMKVLESVKLDTVLKKIENLDLSSLKHYLHKEALAIEPKLKAVVEDGSFTFMFNEFNWFWLLEMICRDNVYNEEYDFYIVPYYFNEELNATIDLTGLFGEFLNDVMYRSDRYVKDFVFFHIFETLKSKLINKHIYKSFTIRYNRSTMQNVFLVNDPSDGLEREEFLTRLHAFMDEDETNEFISQAYPRTDSEGRLTSSTKDHVSIDNAGSQHFVTFAEYSKFIKSIYGDSDDFSMLGLNFSKSIVFKDNNEPYASVMGDGSTEGSLAKCAKILTDICLKIVNIREMIKSHIEQYSLIGTKRIATDILYDFFINNFSDRRDFNYISDLLDISNNVNFDVLKPASALVDDFHPFSIDVVEYYDTGSYLNIKSDMPMVKTGTILKSVEMRPSWFIDASDLIASSMTSAGIYEDVYQPCSYFVTDYNARFWENDRITLSKNIANDDTTVRYSLKDYEKFYSQYDPSLNGISDYMAMTDYVDKKLRPLLSKVWDAFALSAINENEDKLGDLAPVFREYIGRPGGADVYKNKANSVFPTIAPAIDIQNLVPVSEFESDILFVAKTYYGNVVPLVVNATIGMLKAYNDDGVPTDGWMQGRTDFHGYSTYYEYSENKSAISVEPHKRVDIDGPWSYSALQELTYAMLDGSQEESLISSMLEMADIDNGAWPISAVMLDYIYSDGSIYKIEDGEAAAAKHSIAKVDFDYSRNCFTLLKPKDATLGMIMFRESDIPLSIPLSCVVVNNVGGFDRMIEAFVKISTECYDFGVFNDVIWAFGKAANGYELFASRFEFAENRLKLDTTSCLRLQSLNKLNDFVGAVVNGSILTFILFNSYGFLTSLTAKGVEMEQTEPGFSVDTILKASDMPLTILKLDTMTMKTTKDTAVVRKATTPMILDHSAAGSFKFMDDHHVWKTEKYEDTCYIGYEALNANGFNDFSYYIGFNCSTIAFKVYELDFYEDYFYTDGRSVQTGDETIIYSAKMMFLTDLVKTQLEKSTYEDIDMQELKRAIMSKLAEYPRCIMKDGKLCIQFLGFTFFKDASVIEMESVADLLAGVIKQEISARISGGMDIADASLFKMEDFQSALASYTLAKDSIDYVLGIQDSLGVFGEKPVVSSFFSTYSETYGMMKSLPFIRNCMNEDLKIVCFFKNDTGINFINDYAFDLDLTCYIDDPFERDKRVGYGNRYAKTKYISWRGDATKGGYEFLSVDVKRYIRDNYKPGDASKYMYIDLHLCWHESSELKVDEVTVAVCWDFLRENIPVRSIKNAKKDCDNKVLTIRIDMSDQTLSYERSKTYPVVSVAYKKKLTGVIDQDPDIKVGLISLTDEDISNLDTWTPYGRNVGGEYKIDFFAYAAEEDNPYLNYLSDDHVGRATFIINSPLPDGKISDMKAYILNLLDELFRKRANRLNYVTRERLTMAKFSKMCLKDIYFGEENMTTDPRTGIGYIYYAYLNPKFFKEADDMADFQVDEAVVDSRMASYIVFGEAISEYAVDVLKNELFSFAPLNTKTLDGFLAYVDGFQEERRELTVEGYFDFMKDYDSELYESELSAVQVDHEMPDSVISSAVSSITGSIIGYSEMPDIDSYISDYVSFTFKQDLSVDGFYRFMIEYNNDYYLEHLQDSYDSLDN